MCNTMKTGRYGAWLSTVAGQTWVPSMSTIMCRVQTCSAADVDREMDIDWVVHGIVWDQLDYRDVCAHWVPKNPTDDDEVHYMELYGPFLYSLDMLQ